MTAMPSEHAMHRRGVSFALVAIGLAVFAAVAYDARLLANMFGLPAQGGEGAVAMVGLITALVVVASGLRGLRIARLRAAKG